MAYATVAEFQQYLQQTDATDTDVITVVLDRATSIVDEYLTFSFDGYDSVATVRKVQSWGTQSLRLPPHEAGSVTQVVYEGDTTALDEWEYDTDTGMILRTADYPSIGVWTVGRYAVTAKWGYGPVPEAVKEVTLELAVNIYRGRDRGMWTDIIGVDGETGVRFVGGVTNQQRAILKAVKARYVPGVQAA